jgi:tetratricopeptide (TPR) repeat protein
MIPRRFRIAHLLYLAAAVALVLTAFRVDGTSGRVSLLVLLSLLPFALPALVLMRPSRVRAALRASYFDEEAQIVGLERALRADASFDAAAVVKARLRLMALYKRKGRHRDAVAQGASLLQDRGLTHAGESHVRLEMAVCYDSLGLPEKAEAERQAADECLDGRPESALGWLTQGKLYERELRYAEAVGAYSEALDASDDPGFRAEVLWHLVTSAFHAGLHHRAAEYAEEVIASPAVSDGRKFLAHRMAGAAYLNLGRTDDAQRHVEVAHRMGVESGDPEKVANSLSSLAELRLRAGDFDRADALCREAETAAPKGPRQAAIVRSLISYHQGRLAEAMELLDEARRRAVPAGTSHERRMQAVLTKARAGIAAELGRLDQAERDLVASEDGMEADPKLRLLWSATAAFVLARKGSHASALERAGWVLARLDGFANDRHTQLDALAPVGRALFEAGKFAQARDCWEQYLARTRDPLGVTIGARHVGDCLLRLGDVDGARAMYERAAATGVDSFDARQAALAIGAC